MLDNNQGLKKKLRKQISLVIVGILIIPIVIIILLAYQNINYSSRIKENFGTESQQTAEYLAMQINRDMSKYITLINLMEVDEIEAGEYANLFPEIEDIAIIEGLQTTDYLHREYIINRDQYSHLNSMLNGVELLQTDAGGKILIKKQLEGRDKSAIIILSHKYWEQIVGPQVRHKVCVFTNDGSMVLDSGSQDNFLVDNSMFTTEDFQGFFRNKIVNKAGYDYYDTYGKYGRQLVVSYAPIQYPGSDKSIGRVVLFAETSSIIADKRVSEIAMFITIFLAGTVLARLIFSLSETIITQFIRISKDYDSISHETEIMKQKLQVSEKLASMGRVTSGITHEIGNPLSSILSICQLLESVRLSEDQRTDYISRIKNDALRIDRLIKELLQSTKGVTEEYSQIDVNDLVNKALAALPEARTNENIRVYKDLETNLPYIEGARENLQIALSNIILNAHQATEDGGSIYIKTYKQDNYIAISVKDTGSGISKEDLKNIFDPFYSTKPIGEGSGIGLFICQQTVKSHGGMIKVISALGEGTEFIVRLPFEAKD
ncbi:MAG: sensor histidine kinase [Tissierellaceae bacterium]|nr:hypothetical protein [Tissierellia bacterium]